MFNMHAVVRGAIEAVNEDTPGTVYVSTGRTASRGILTPTFAPVTARLQVQAKQHTPLAHERGALYNNTLFSVWAYGNFNDLDRPDGSGGDVVNFGGKWWYITQVIEWWPQWCQFEITKQLDAASIAALLAQLANGANP